MPENHQNQSGKKSHWRWLIGLGFLAALGIATAPMLKTALRELPWALRHLSWGWLLLCIPAQAGVYGCLAEILGVSLAALGYRRVPRWSLLPTGAAFLLANRAIPGPAVAGLAVLVHRLKQKQIPAEVSHAVAAAFFGADYAGFFILALGALPFLANDGRLGPLHPSLLVAAFALILLCVALLVVIYRIPGFLEKIAGRAGRLWATLRRQKNRDDEWTEKGRMAVTAFRERAADLAKRPQMLLRVGVWALLMHLCEVTTLVLAVCAFGGRSAFSVTAAGYVAGNLGAIVSFFPGGAGLYEGGMIAALHLIGGLRNPIPLAATLLYRLLTLWLPMPFALAAIRHTTKAKDDEKTENILA
jgi:uncharacterized protein (TIRG00374 family)